jgi:peptidoglycan/LPS O-acetylase OafA/YrhL
VSVANAAGSGADTIGSIQVLRGIAAISVVLHHAVRAFTVYHAAGPTEPLLFSPAPFSQVFAIGVDVFFVISGFIMAYISGPYRASAKSPVDFLSRRVIRIYPMYLLATVACVGFLWFDAMRQGGPRPFDLSPSRVFNSIAFIPSFDAQGEVQPVLGVGWTLYYEMYFYLMLTLMLALFRGRAIAGLVISLLAVCGAANLAGALGWTGGAAGAFLRSPQIIDFIFGLGLGELHARQWLPRVHPAVPLAVGLAWIAAAWRLPPDNLEFLLWGAPSALIVAGFLLLEKRRRRPWPAWAMVFGDASYAVYLFHTMLIYDVVLFVLRRANLLGGGRLAVDAYIVLCVLAAGAGGVLIHLAVERPVTGWLRRSYATVAFRGAPA